MLSPLPLFHTTILFVNCNGLLFFQLHSSYLLNGNTHTHTHTHTHGLKHPLFKKSHWGDLQDGRGVRRGDHLPPHKYIKNTSICGTTPTEHILNTSRRPQISQKGTDTLKRPTSRGRAKSKAETQELCKQRREMKISLWSLRSSGLNLHNQLDVPASAEYLNRKRITPKLRQWTLGATVDLGFAFCIKFVSGFMLILV